MPGECGSNTLFMPRPTMDAAMRACATSCGMSTTDPVGCGNIGARKSREKVREQIKDFVLAMLGAPVIKIEMDNQQLDIAVDEALALFEEYAGREYFNYYTFNSVPGQSVYTLPADVGIVRQVYYREQPNFAFSSASELGGVLPIEYYYPGSSYASIQGGLLDPNQPVYGRAGEWMLYKQYEQMYNRMSSQIGGWEFIDGPCNIKIYPIPCRCTPVIVHYLQKKPDFKQVTYAMKAGSLAFAKSMLGRIRSKYASLPGPQGGTNLDGLQLLQEGKEELEKWLDDLINRWGDGPQSPIDLA